MAKILLIETSTALCSVAVEKDGKILSSCSDASRRHASLTAVFCERALSEAGMKVSDLDAVCISDGPGSYTGLRVGLSTAKGLCFGGGLKMLSVSSLDILAAMAPRKADFTVPMIDARRSEVFTATYDSEGRRISGIEARVIEEGAYADIADKAVFIGDGALKCRDIIGKGEFIETMPEAAAMAELAENEFREGNFRDIAYFEPFYLKDYVPTVSKKKMF